jgi:acyl dehydratase
MPYGRWFEEFTPGQHPVHSDANYAEKYTQHGQRLVLGPLVFSIGIGMTVADVSGRAIANLEIERISHDKPVFIGDTVYGETTVLETTASEQGDRAVVHVETRVTHQRGEVVMTFRRKALVPKRNHATLGEGRLPA